MIFHSDNYIQNKGSNNDYKVYIDNIFVSYTIFTSTSLKSILI